MRCEHLLLSRIYRYFMGLILPGELVRDYGQQIADTFDDLCDDARASKRWLPGIRVLMREVCVLCLTAIKYRRRLAPDTMHSQAWRTKPRRWSARPFCGDVGYAIRALTRHRYYSLAAIFTFAIGIGANTAVFTLLHAVLLRPMPFAEPERLYFVENTKPGQSAGQNDLSYADFKDWQEQTRGLTELVGFRQTKFPVSGGHVAERVEASWVSANFTDVLGVQPLLGRGFTEGEEAPGVELSVLIGEGLWRRTHGGDPAIVGSSISVDGEGGTVIGILPDYFRFPAGTEIWAPFRIERSGHREWGILNVFGRLGEGVSRQRAEDDIERVTRVLSEQHPATNSESTIELVHLRKWIFGDEREPVLLVYMVVCLLLLLVCANVAGLVLSRNESRRHEFAVRVSLGAGKLRIFRQLLLESLLLAFVAGALGAAMGWFARDLLLVFLPTRVPHYFSFDIDWAILVAVCAIVAVSAAIFALPPAIATTRSDLQSALRSARGAGDHEPPRSHLRFSLVSFEIALALAVLIGANLMVKGAVRQRSLDPGYTADQVATVTLSLPDLAYYGTRQRVSLYERILPKVRSLPGISAASIVTGLPNEYANIKWPIHVEHAEVSGTGQVPLYATYSCWPGFFSTMGIPLIRGSVFEDVDIAGGRRNVVIVNETFAESHWPQQDPVGKRLAMGGEPPEENDWYEVLGVVGDTYNAGYGRAVEPAVYFAYPDIAIKDVVLVARTYTNAQSMFSPIREVVRSIDSDIPLGQFRTIERVASESNWQMRLYVWTFALFSLISLTLSVTGVYGITAFNASRRSREFAIRMAVGADQLQIKRLVLNTALWTACFGVLLGLFVSLGGSRIFASVLFLVSPTDLGVYAVSVVLMFLIVLLASYIPARRVTRMAPMRVLGEGMSGP
jgi:putative ABC transport system permease protein